MMKTKTKEQFIKDARKVHGNRYSYNKVEYKNAKTEVEIICPIHGSFWQISESHLRGQGCKICGKIRSNHLKRLSFKEVKRRFIEAHGDFYDYSKVNYVNRSTLIEIICPLHGSFWQMPDNHWSGHGCKKCNGGGVLTFKEFIKRVKKIHGNIYDYSKVKYKNAKTKVEIICPIHGSFWQVSGSHMDGSGCKKCAGNEKIGFNEFIKRAKKIHGNIYDYSKVKYKNAKTKVEIICPIHGSFWQVSGSHMDGSGCKKCVGNEKFTKEQFIKKSENQHKKGTYDYSKVKYINSKTKVEIICKKHGSFWQKPENHFVGASCPRCNQRVSKKSQKWLESLNISTMVTEYAIKIGSKKYIVDGYDQQTNTIYEFFGDFWHGNPEKFDLDEINPKTKTTYRELYEKTLNKISDIKKTGYNLVLIWESEFDQNNDTKIKDSDTEIKNNDTKIKDSDTKIKDSDTKIKK